MHVIYLFLISIEFLQQYIQIMSNQGDFHFEQFEIPKTNTNMQDILEKDDKFSIDWQKFDNPKNQQSKSHSAISDIFNKSKKSSSQLSEKKDNEDSRDILQISIFASQNPQQTSFRFEKQDQRPYPKNNERFSKLQLLLQNAKKNSLQQFYKNIDQQNKAYIQQPQKFGNYNQFKDYIKQLKTQKRQKQQKLPQKIPQKIPQKDAFNFFDSVNSNKAYVTSSYNQNNNNNKIKSQNSEKYESKQIKRQQKNAKQQYNFSKKSTPNNVFSSNNFLPNQFSSENFYQYEEPPKQNKPSPIQKFNNFYEPKTIKLPDKAPEHNNDQDAFDFFQNKKKQQNDKKDQKMKQSLQPIRQQKHNSFQRTFQQQKLDDLFKNYQSMRKNFEQLMQQFKSTNQGQQKIVSQLRKLKDEKYENQLRQSRKERKQKRQKEIQEKNKKLDNIKDQIHKIKSSDKDILYSQINMKIQQLQSVVRSALQEINEEKQIKIVPKITNYFCEHQKIKQRQSIDRQFQKQFQMEEYNQNDHKQQRSVSEKNSEQSRDLFTQKFEVENKNKFSNEKQKLKVSMKRQNVKTSEPKLRSSNQNQAKSKSNYSSRVRQNMNIENVFSPLDLNLHTNIDYYQNEAYYEDFTPKQFSEEHIPRQFQVNTKTYRNCLTQKSSVVYQSFDFHVSARFSIVDDQLHPIVAALRIGNKCSIDLYDVHVIIYGPLGPGISTDPSTVFQEEVKKSSSFSFQVSVDKSCLQDNGFSIQISYKTDSMSKKKINFKIPLPLVQLIRPEFIYQQKFMNDWNSLNNQLYIKPKRLDSTYLRSHEDLKLILPFIEINQDNSQSFSYGIMFRYPKCDNIFYLKVTCYVSGKAAIQLRTQKSGDRKIKQQIMNVLNFIFYSPN